MGSLKILQKELIELIKQRAATDCSKKEFSDLNNRIISISRNINEIYKDTPKVGNYGRKGNFI